MRHASYFTPANDPPPDIARITRHVHARHRGELASSLLFAGGSIAIFVVLLACVFAATVLYYRWH
ncbi:MAG: hypothetical protein ABI655_13540 [Phenylobacterium sp.]